MAHVGDEVAGAPEKAGAAGVEGVLIADGLIARKFVGAAALVRMFAAKRARAALASRPSPAPRSSRILSSAGRGEIPLPDHAEQRVRCPRRIAETSITFGRSDRGTPRRDAGELQAQSADLTGDRLPLAQGRGQAADRPLKGRHPNRFTPVHGFGCLGGCRGRLCTATAYSLGVDELVGHLNLPGTRPPSRSPTTPGATRHDRADSGSPTAAPICATLLLPPAASGPA